MNKTMDWLPQTITIWSWIDAFLRDCSDSQVQIPTGACEKGATDLGSGGSFSWVLRFPPPLTSHDNMVE